MHGRIKRLDALNNSKLTSKIPGETAEIYHSRMVEVGKVRIAPGELRLFMTEYFSYGSNLDQESNDKK